MNATPAGGLFLLRETLRQQGPLSRSELARCLRRPPSVIQAMLEHWAKRGRLQVVAPAAAQAQPAAGCAPRACHGCAGCATAGADARDGGGGEPRYAWCEARRVDLRVDLRVDPGVDPGVDLRVDPSVDLGVGQRVAGASAPR